MGGAWGGGNGDSATSINDRIAKNGKPKLCRYVRVETIARAELEYSGILEWRDVFE